MEDKRTVTLNKLFSRLTWLRKNGTDQEYTDFLQLVVKEISNLEIVGNENFWRQLENVVAEENEFTSEEIEDLRKESEREQLEQEAEETALRADEEG